MLPKVYANTLMFLMDGHILRHDSPAKNGAPLSRDAPLKAELVVAATVATTHVATAHMTAAM